MKKFWKWAVILMTATMAAGLASRLIRKYRKAVRLFDETQSDDIGSYIDWLSLFTWWAVIYGIGCGLFNLACGLGKKFCCQDKTVQNILLFPTSALATINIRFEWHSHCAHLCGNVSGHMFSFWGKEIIQIYILFNHA